MSPQTSQGRDNGFSLIELLCVIVVLGVLATVVVLSVGGQTGGASEAARGADEAVLVTALEAYHVNNGHYVTEDLLVEAGLLRSESTLWDVLVDDESDKFTLVAAGGGTTTDPPVTTAAPATGVTCSFVVDTAWETGGNATLSITNGTDTTITSWTVRIANGGRTIGLWSASGASSDGTHLTASDQGWNGVVAAGQTTTPTGGSVSGSGLSGGQSFDCTVVPTVFEADSVTCAFEVGSAWGSGGNGTLSITNGSSTRVTNWTVKIATTPTKSVSLWNATNTAGASSLTASSLSWNGVVEVGATTSPTGGSVSGSGITGGDSFDCTVVSVG